MLKTFSEGISTGIDRFLIAPEPVYEFPGLAKIGELKMTGIGVRMKIPRILKSKVLRIQKELGVALSEIKNAVEQAAAEEFITPKEGKILRMLIGFGAYQKVKHLIKKTEGEIAEKKFGEYYHHLVGWY